VPQERLRAYPEWSLGEQDTVWWRPLRGTDCLTVARFARQQGAPQPLLVVEDDPQVVELLTVVLERSGHRVIVATDGQEALRRFFADRPALVLLDLGIPEPDGWELLGRIRELSDTPVIVLTGEVGELEKVQALGSGADDYVTKPFGSAELVARVQAVLRRARAHDVDEVHDDGVVRIDFASRVVTAAGRPVRLTPTEFRLLAALARHPSQVLSRDQLLEMVWGNPGIGAGDEVRVYIGYLRRKLGEVLDEDPIETVRGFGYRWAPARVAQAR
jgi:DNA-binding response OmpR family regulator